MDKTIETRDLLVVIPARGGSKGIPGKNSKLLAGKPLIAYAIGNALSVASPEDICVSTDSDEIALIASRHGVPVPFMRPSELATDTATTYDVLLHALRHYESKGRTYRRILLLQPTSPLLRQHQVREALDLYTGQADMVVSVKESAANPYYNLFESDGNGFLQISKGDGEFTRRQDAPKVWEYNGAIYVINTESLRKSPLSAFKRRIPYVMDAKSSVDIDTELDWILAQQLICQKQQ